MTGPTRSTPHAPAAAGRPVDADAHLDEARVHALMRDQLRLALRILLLLAATVATLPLLFHLAPGVADVRVAGLVPLSWLLLGALIHPWLIVLGTAFVRAAEANERASGPQ